MASPQREAPSDSALVNRMAAGEDRALGELYDRHGATAYSVACGILRDPADAEEIVADAFVQLWNTAAGFDPARGSALAWLITITRSRALDRLRSRRRHERLLERAATEDARGFAVALATPGHEPERGTEREETRRLVERSLAELPEAQRRVLELAYFTGLSQSEIARALGEPLGTVKTRMRAGMEKLRQALSAASFEAGR
ncbi:MAG: sigma-70 family RNA polymerase sigma factor [Gemmatimonadetes bacterium]|nr:sigma-70 family RNA polymerase sigma factor [Gemmatimonadota bacterium]